MAEKDPSVVGPSLSFPRALAVSEGRNWLRRAIAAASGRWLRRSARLGQGYSEPATAGPEYQTPRAKTGIRVGRFADAVSCRFVALIAVCVLPQVTFSEEFEFIGKFDWETESVMGLSGVEITENGNGFYAISDRGWWLEASLQRKNGRVSGVEIKRMAGMKGPDGLPVSARRVGDWSDAEGLALTADGTAWVAFERWAHVWKYDQPFGKAQWTKDHPTFFDHADNWQLEAIAVSPDGTVIAFSEKPLQDGFPIYRLQADNTWIIDGYLPEEDVFAIVGADFAPDGSLYILERKLVVGLWWQNRVRRVRLDGSEDTVLWTGDRGEFGNLEGISVWEDSQGLRFTMISDNNGRETNPTEIVEFRLTE